MSAPKPYDPFLQVLRSANDCFLAGMGTKAAVRTAQEYPQYEDQLPDNITDAEYNAWYEKSAVVDGVRMGPRFPDPTHYPAEAPAIRRTLKALMNEHGIHTVIMLLAEAEAEILAEHRAQSSLIDHDRSDAK